MWYIGENQKLSRRGFLKRGFAGILGALLLILSGCVPGDDDDDGGDEDDD